MIQAVTVEACRWVGWGEAYLVDAAQTGIHDGHRRQRAGTVEREHLHSGEQAR